MSMQTITLKNKTSQVPVSRSIENIEKLLVKAGARQIGRDYDDGGKLKGFLFQFIVDGTPLMFKLPAKPLAVQRIMEKEIKKPRRGTQNRVMDQAERTAWKVLHDWIELQVTMIQLDQAEAIQIFLPYWYDGQKDETFYDRLKSTNFKQLTTGKAT